jgi:phage protein D/phage baseplate assembly protein gpV
MTQAIVAPPPAVSPIPPVSTLPPLTVEVAHAPLREGDLDALVSVRVSQRLSAPAQCELTFVDPADQLAGGEFPMPGNMMRVRAGSTAAPAGGDALLFAGEVTHVSHSIGPDGVRTVRVRGYDPLHRLRKRQPVRAHVRVTAADLARDLVADLGLSLEATDAGPVWDRVIQSGPSDFQLLVDVADRGGLYLVVHDDVLHLLTLSGTGDALELEVGRSLLEANVEVTGESACRSVTTAAWDPARVESRTGRATSPRVGRDVTAEVLPADVGGADDRTVVDAAVREDRQAEALAQAELDRRVAAEVVLRGVAVGDARLRPGVPIRVTGVAAHLDGQYVLTEVEHTIDARVGYTATLSTAPPPRPPRRRAIIPAAWGRVTRVDDPDQLGRVRVALPAHADVETDWLGVVTAGAGAGKGLVALPDVDDHVLVLFAGDDRSQGVVVGGLYGAAGAPDAGGVEGNAVRRYSLGTPGGQRLRLDDARRSVRLETTDGTYLEMTPDSVTLHAATDLTIEAPGRVVKIAAAAVKFKTDEG